MNYNPLTPEEERVIVQKRTETPYSGEYDDFYQAGTFICRRCNAPLFSSKSKFDAHCGWPAFDSSYPNAIKRVGPVMPFFGQEVVCTNCGAHLGHEFTGERFTNTNTRECVNSLAIKFIKEGEELPAVIKLNNQNIDKVAWIYIKERKILGAKSFNKEAYYIPGGKRDSGESDLEVLVRELKEELDIDFKTESAKFIGEFKAQAHGKPEGVFVVMKCYSGDFKGDIKPSSEIEEVDWLTSKDIETPRTSPVDKIILQDLKDKDLID